MEEQVTHVYGEGFILGIPGKFANATVLVDVNGNVTSHALGSASVEEVKEVAPEQEQAPIVEEVPPVQVVIGG